MNQKDLAEIQFLIYRSVGIEAIERLSLSQKAVSHVTDGFRLVATKTLLRGVRAVKVVGPAGTWGTLREAVRSGSSQVKAGKRATGPAAHLEIGTNVEAQMEQQILSVSTSGRRKMRVQ